MSEHTLAVEKRTDSGKGVARKLRAAGRLPAVLYGPGQETVSLSLDPRALESLIESSDAGLNTLIDLTGDVTGKTILIKELQRDPVRGRPVHADLYQIDLDTRITVHVPIHVVGTAPGVILGGLLDHALREVELDCLPRAIPDEIEVDVSELEQGDSLHVRDLPLPSDVELRSDPELSVVSVVAPSVEEEPVAEEAEALEEGAEAAPEEDGEAESGDAPPDSKDSKASKD